MRILKIFDLLYELRNFRIILDTIRYMAKPLLYLGGALFILFYIFAILGIYFFGG